MTRTRITALTTATDLVTALEQDVREGLLVEGQKSLPPKYFYDGPGSQLFVKITELDEYYPTRAETEILERVAGDLMARIGPEEIVELGSGASHKTRLLLEAMHAAGTGDAYVPLDVSEDALEAAAQELVADYDWLHVDGYVGDFHSDLHRIPHPTGRRVVAFLGSTIGNFLTDDRIELLREVARMLQPDDRFVVGVDLVKPREVLEAAYDDSAGVTAAFNKNMLVNVNWIVGSDFDPDEFDHRAVWNADESCIEMRLVARQATTVRFPTLGEKITFTQGEHLLTEHSCKFTREDFEEQLAHAGLVLDAWETDSLGRFALGVVRTT